MQKNKKEEAENKKEEAKAATYRALYSRFVL
jgi:hypothetical protein